MWERAVATSRFGDGDEEGGTGKVPPPYPDSCREFPHRLRSRIVPAEKGGVWEAGGCNSRFGDGDEEGGTGKSPLLSGLEDSPNRLGQAAGYQLVAPIPRVNVVQEDILLHLIENRGQVEE